MNKTQATYIFAAALAFSAGTPERDAALLACSKIRIRGLTGRRTALGKATGAAAAKRAATKRNNIRKHNCG